MRRARKNRSNVVPGYRRRNRRHQFESLEARLLLAADPVLTDFVAYAVGPLDVDRELLVQSGFLGAEDRLQVNQGSQTRGLYSGFDLAIDRSSIVDGDVRSNDKIDIHRETTILGDIDAGGRIQLDQDVHVTGAAVSAHYVESQSNTMVDGGIVENGDPLSFNFLALPHATSFATDPSNDVWAGRNSTMALVPGLYGDLEIERNSSLALTAGEYFFDEINVGRESQLILDVAAGAISIYVEGNVALDRNFEAIVVGGGAERVFVESHGQFSLGRESTWWGTIFAPHGQVGVDRETVVTGAIYSGDRIDLDRNITLN
jgi:hypothetical protein